MEEIKTIWSSFARQAGIVIAILLAIYSFLSSSKLPVFTPMPVQLHDAECLFTPQSNMDSSHIWEQFQDRRQRGTGTHQSLGRKRYVTV